MSQCTKSVATVNVEADYGNEEYNCYVERWKEVDDVVRSRVKGGVN